ncbi:MarR family transcriptional regulator [Nitrospirillum sp. BR 11163]|uniref:MarR family winged helix-turn-helix transcriptional regulator n=1 Tax=Nitrospirillum sp. BR 11163 TaxID=3104323 RepID=UPI002AFFEC1E|nr:MarR family transcriptional regulator [Nitrospirillum sp. BR 11163]MEA1673035.1 MarR family transcriptional regulator [Nitrospirillum sp. BR 11163]
MEQTVPLPITPRHRAFGLTLLYLTRRWRREADAALKAYGQSEATALPLVVLARLGDGIRQGQLADHVGVEGPSLVRLVDMLERDGLLERRNDPRDRRVKTLHLTAEGRALAVRLDDALDGMRQRLLAEVTPEQLDTTLTVFAAVERALGRSPSAKDGGEGDAP